MARFCQNRVAPAHGSPEDAIIIVIVAVAVAVVFVHRILLFVVILSASEIVLVCDLFVLVCARL